MFFFHREDLVTFLAVLKRRMKRISLHGVFPGPLPGQLGVLVLVRFENSRDFGDEGIVGIGITQKGADGEQDLNLRNNELS